MIILTGDDIYIQNDYIDEIVNNPENFDFEQIMFASEYTPFKYKLYDFLLINYGFIEGSTNLKDYLLYTGEYEEYANRVLNGDNNLLKCNFILYLEYHLFSDLFESVSYYIDIVMNDSKNDSKYKICNLTVLSNFNCSENDISKIKKSIKYLIETDEELKKEYSNKEIKNIVKEKCLIIDKNHDEYKENVKKLLYIK